MRPLIPLFRPSGDVCPGFQSQGGSLACVLCRLDAMDSSEAPLGRHLPTSCSFPSNNFARCNCALIEDELFENGTQCFLHTLKIFLWNMPICGKSSFIWNQITATLNKHYPRPRLQRVRLKWTPAYKEGFTLHLSVHCTGNQYNHCCPIKCIIIDLFALMIM